MAKRYQVVRGLGYFTDRGLTGTFVTAVLAPALVPESATEDEIRHNLSVGIIVEVDGPDTEPEQTQSEPGTGDPQTSDEELSEERKAAQAKLPEDGSLPHANASKAVWVEAAVKRGYSYEAASKVDKAELVALLKG